MKKVGQSTYIHVSAIEQNLTFEQQKKVAAAFKSACSHYPGLETRDVSVVKISPSNISFLVSPDWDTATEPRIDFSYVVHTSSTGYPDGGNCVKFLDFRARHIIYHHKWMFVTMDYNGFDLGESRAWSQYWTNHPAVKALAKRDPKWRSKIGNYDYWKKNVLDVIYND
jgi:hypothetical protein